MAEEMDVSCARLIDGFWESYPLKNGNLKGNSDIEKGVNHG